MRVKKYQQFHTPIASVSGWDQEGDYLHKSFEFENFEQAWGFMNRVVEFAREMNHHPKILNDGAKVELWLTTHDEGTITSKDIALAEEINKIRL